MPIQYRFRASKKSESVFCPHGISLTTDVDEIEEWQGGDIVIFHNHVGIVSDHRNKNGVPYVIHHSNPVQDSYEQNILEIRSDIVGHYRMSR